jgi:hypothetical protein
MIYISSHNMGELHDLRLPISCFGMPSNPTLISTSIEHSVSTATHSMVAITISCRHSLMVLVDPFVTEVYQLAFFTPGRSPESACIRKLYWRGLKLAMPFRKLFSRP